MCRICSSLAIAYIEMPDENTVISANEIALKPRVFSSKRSRRYSGHRARARAVVERHHEDAEEDHRRNRADPVEVAGRDAVLRARRRHADDFLRAEVGRDERQPADPRRDRAPRLKERRARRRPLLQRDADAEDEGEVDQHQQPVEPGQGHQNSRWSLVVSLVARDERIVTAFGEESQIDLQAEWSPNFGRPIFDPMRGCRIRRTARSTLTED